MNAHPVFVDPEDRTLRNDKADADSDALDGEAHWQLAQRVVASRQFARSCLLSKFLLYIVAETVEGRAAGISEHQIGVHVFGRPASYRTVEDNIVRNYARQLRRRLAEYFADEGAAECCRIAIPLGGYVPVFERLPTSSLESPAAERAVPIRILSEAGGAPAEAATSSQLADPSPASRRLRLAALLGVYSLLLIAISWFAAVRFHADAGQTGPCAPLWSALFQGPLDTYIVPADAGLNLLEDLSRQPLTLADYINEGYSRVPLPAMDAHSEEDLRTQRFTSFVDLQIMAALTRLPEYNPQRAIVRFPRDLQVDDLRNDNAIILGSVGSDPWAAVAEANANFRIVYRNGMQGATIVNAKPMPGEAAEYVSHWNEPAHETYALISCLPNLAGNGRLLILQGLDVAGTQAAADTLFHPAAIAPILRRAARSDGSPGYFEILLRTTSLESSATRTEVIGSRVY